MLYEVAPETVVQVTVTWALPGVAVTPVGAAGTPPPPPPPPPVGVAVATELSTLSPEALMAVTTKAYCVPLVRFATTFGEVALATSVPLDLVTEEPAL